MSSVVRVELQVEIEDFAGYTPEAYVEGLERNLSAAIGDGVLTGATPEIELESYRLSVSHCGPMEA